MPKPKPLQQQIADTLRAEIASGKYRPGAHLPSERELGEEFGAARNTVRLGLAALVAEGLIVSSRGRGYFVRDFVPLTYYASRSEKLLLPDPASPVDAFVGDTRHEGREPRGEFTLRIEPAVPFVAAALKIEPESPAVIRSILRFVDGAPWSIQDTWYPMDLAKGSRLIEPFDIPEGTTRYLRERGHEQVGHWDEWTVRMPTPAEASKLELGPGTPVLICRRTGYTTKRPVRITETIFAGDRNRIVYESGDLSARNGE
jgi:GntR family transcriptional regulator